MLFNSIHFGVFFLVVWTLVALLRHRVTARNWVLLIASYYFYAWWDWRFLSLLAATTLFDYYCGRMLHVPDHVPGHHILRNHRDRVFVAASMTLNLTFLGFFKYFNFFVSSAASLLSSMGFQPHVPALTIILPIGISFYTFQSMNYVIDVYRGELNAERNLLNFAVFVSFFPHLVAGPILRATSLMPQIRSPNAILWPRISSGFYLIVWGLFKKVVIADNVAVVVDHVFQTFPATFGQAATFKIPGGGTAMLGVYAFAVQIYCDFSGYTDMARGLSRTMGFELPRNFNLPYFAVNPSDFWTRWHISLSSWLRDYLYIPLGGNRKGPKRTYVNLMITMLLGGLWHGAAWTFVIWGAYHGTLLCVHRAMRPWLERAFRPGTVFGQRAWYVIRALIFFHLVCLGWLLFRAASMEQVALMLKAIGVTLFKIDQLNNAMLVTVIACMLILLAVQLAQALSRDAYVAFRLPVPIRALVYACVILGVIIYGQTGGRAFIYFQF